MTIQAIKAMTISRPTAAETPIPAFAPLLSSEPLAVGEVEKEVTKLELIWLVVGFEIEDAVGCTFQPTIGSALTVTCSVLGNEVKEGMIYEPLF